MTFAYVLPDVGSESEMQDLTLPVEVMHYDVFGEQEGNSELPMYGGNSPRYVESVTFDVSGDPGDLWLWGHHIGFQYFGDWFDWQQGDGDLVWVTSTYEAPYDGRAKAAIRINGGDWIDLTNENVTCQENEEKQACIQGFMSSNRFKVDNTAAMLQSGSNTIDFAFLGHEMLSSGIRTLNVEDPWSPSRLQGRSRGNITGSLNLLPENIQLEATGTDSGLRPKGDPQQYEAVDECQLGQRWDFSFDGFSGQYGVWGRAGLKIESDHADGHEVVVLDYLPLQRRMRLSAARSGERSVRERLSEINVDTPLLGYVELEDIQQRANFMFYLDTTGDGEYNEIHSIHMDTFYEACEISLTATSRISGQQIEALFTLEKVE